MTLSVSTRSIVVVQFTGSQDAHFRCIMSEGQSAGLSNALEHVPALRMISQDYELLHSF